MDTKRIKAAAKNLRLAHELISNAFEDLKNVKEFRESHAGTIESRENIKSKLQAAIWVAEECAKGEPQ